MYSGLLLQGCSWVFGAYIDFFFLFEESSEALGQLGEEGNG